MTSGHTSTVFAWRAQIDPRSSEQESSAHATRRIDWGFTTTAPDVGSSIGDFAGFNLGGHVGDDPVAVEHNRSALAQEMGVDRSHLLFMNQVHGADVVVADGPWSGEPQAADGVVTATPGLAPVVLVADCTPILLADPEAGVVGAVHAGRPGLAAGVVDAAVSAARDLGARRLSAAVGPSVCGRCYEVPEAMRDEVAAVHPVSATVSWAGTPALDVAAGVVARLRSLEVDVTWVPGCTRESTQFYSYRRSARTGRFAGVVVMA